MRAGAWRGGATGSDTGHTTVRDQQTGNKKAEFLLEPEPKAAAGQNQDPHLGPAQATPPGPHHLIFILMILQEMMEGDLQIAKGFLLL